MLRASRNITVFTRLLNRFYFSDGQNDQKSNLVPVIIDNQKNFYKNIYGM